MINKDRDWGERKRTRERLNVRFARLQSHLADGEGIAGEHEVNVGNLALLFWQLLKNIMLVLVSMYQTKSWASPPDDFGGWCYWSTVFFLAKIFFCRASITFTAGLSWLGKPSYQQERIVYFVYRFLTYFRDHVFLVCIKCRNCDKYADMSYKTQRHFLNCCIFFKRICI